SARSSPRPTPDGRSSCSARPPRRGTSSTRRTAPRWTQTPTWMHSAAGPTSATGWLACRGPRSNGALPERGRVWYDGARGAVRGRGLTAALLPSSRAAPGGRMSTDLPFRDLIVRVRLGDQRAAAELVGRYEPAIRRAVRFRLTDPRLRRTCDSMDVCQSVL